MKVIVVKLSSMNLLRYVCKKKDTTLNTNMDLFISWFVYILQLVSFVCIVWNRYYHEIKFGLDISHMSAFYSLWTEDVQPFHMFILSLTNRVTWLKWLFPSLKVSGFILAPESGYHNVAIHESSVLQAVLGIVF